MTLTGREIRLASRPVGMPVCTNFTQAEVELPAPADGQLVVRNLFMSVDPYMRSRMDETMVHMSPFRIGSALDGAAIGEVVQSRSAHHREGDLVAHGLGWRDLAVLPADSARTVRSGRFSPSAHLGILGMPGMTAWYGLRTVGRFQPGETVFVSAAAGAVGSTVGQLVKHYGGTVIGCAGSDEKVHRLVEELGFDHAFSYRDSDSGKALHAIAPDGIDLYFDNVGGDQLEAALTSLKPYGRITACGMVAHANHARPGPSNLPLIVGKRLSVNGFIISDHYELRLRFEEEIMPLVEEGRVQVTETVVTGLDRAPDALIGLLNGENIGKMVVAL
jgi:NADPH-dependent curcumin reductase CurA